jgi:hypothetical protein
MGVVISNGDVPSSNDVEGVPIFVFGSAAIAVDENNLVDEQSCCFDDLRKGRKTLFFAH